MRISTYLTQYLVQVLSPADFMLAVLTPLAAQTDDRQYPPDSAQNQVQGSSNFIDGSGAIFSMYLERAAEEDKKMAENWKADANGILIFVRFHSSSLVHHTNPMVIERPILRCCCIAYLGVHSGHTTEPAGRFQLLPREYLSSYN